MGKFANVCRKMRKERFFNRLRPKKKIVIFEKFSLNFAQILMTFYRNFADILEIVEIS